VIEPGGSEPTGFDTPASRKTCARLQLPCILTSYYLPIAK
jgi:hypothetical protein